jgi:hypothetical protein
MSITSVTCGSGAAFEPGRLKQQRESFNLLSSALESGDIAAAKKAYVSLAQNAREGAAMKAGSPFAQLGKALAAEDLPAAQASFAKLGRGIVPAPSLPAEPPTAPIVKAPSLPAEPPVYAPPVFIAPTAATGCGTLLASA